MRRYCFQFVVISMVLGSAAFGQSNYGFRLVGRALPGEANASYVAGDLCYQGAGNSLQVYDVTNSSEPVMVGQLGLIDQVEDVFISGSHAYIANGMSGLAIADVSSPSELQSVGSLVLEDEALGVKAAGNWAYLACLTGGFKVVEVSLPDAPELLASFPVEWAALDLDISGDIAGVACGYGGLYFIDISNPFEPIQASQIDTQDTWVDDVRFGGSYAYMAYSLYEGGGGLKVIDVSNPRNARVVGVLSLSASFASIDISGNYVFAATEDNGMIVVDVSSPSTPRVVGGWHNGYGKTVFCAEGRTYLSCGEEGLRIFSTTNPLFPQLSGTYATFSSCQDIEVAGHYAYIVEKPSGIRVIDIQNPELPRAVYHNQFYFENGDYQGVGEGISVIGDRLYVVDYRDLYGGENDFRIYNIGNPAQPDSLGIYTDLGTSPRGFKIKEDIAYIATGRRITILDIRDAENIELLNEFEGDWHSAHGMDLIGNYIYMGTMNTGLRILNIVNEDVPQIVGSLDTDGIAYSAKYHSGYIYLADDTCGLRIIDAGDFSNLIEVARYSAYSDCIDVAIIENTAGSFAIALFDDEVIALDVNDPANPVEVGYYWTNDPHKLICRGDTIYVADRDNGLHILTLDNEVSVSEEWRETLPQRSILARNYPNPFNSETMIEFNLPDGGATSVQIFDITGRKVAELFNGYLGAGINKLRWNGKDDKGHNLSSGVYFYKVTMGEKSAVGRMLTIQ